MSPEWIGDDNLELGRAIAQDHLQESPSNFQYYFSRIKTTQHEIS